jgi:hypothetical protein
MQEGMSGERVWPNLGGERVTKRPPRKERKPARGGPDDEPEAPDRRALIVGVLGTAVWLPRLVPVLLGKPPAPPVVSTTGDEGDCVTSPALETALLATVSEALNGTLSTPQFYEADWIVRQLEVRGWVGGPCEHMCTVVVVMARCREARTEVTEGACRRELRQRRLCQ